ncbi:hypothetical protein U14_00776 [Candidatus Moduliflexus flocculans]|uniref:Tetratricopeptide repeat protein n=1 Tax=Candidatus Moduliflexus flocculans TaxID=1499966 RepID=A0A0S6VW03_9BACT|nr:hypothetical protein U14_00776 [Candidatus Moduliflexus flocculans]
MKPVFLRASLAILIIASYAASAATPKWYEYYRLSKTYVEAQQWDVAIELLKKAIAERPQSSRKVRVGFLRWTSYYPYLDLGMAYLALGKFDEAQSYCSQAQSEGITPLERVNDCLVQIDSSSLKSEHVRSLSPYPPEIPEFPWPPPKASAQATVPTNLLVRSGRPTLLKDVAKRLEDGLLYAGYEENSYFYIPRGFALVTRVEQFYPDGRSKEGAKRWADTLPPQTSFSLASYLKALFTAEKGYYRIIVFLVTSVPVRQSSQEISRDDANAWLNRGANMLPPSIGSLQFSKDHTCVALVYEFEQMSRDHEPAFKSPSLILGRMHLQQSRIWEGLERLARQG